MRVVIDSSAVIALLRREPGHEPLTRVVGSSDEILMSTGTWLETSIVVQARRDPVLTRAWDHLWSAHTFTLMPVDSAQALIAREAYRDFGKGTGHPAQLNFGDCFAYALAKELRLPLLAVGDDFRHTDLTVLP